MSNFVVRDANPDDALGIATVHVKTWQCAYKGQIPDDFLANLSIEQRHETWKRALENKESGTHTIVVAAGKKILGWATFGKTRDTDVAVNVGELYGIYVAPENIGQGIGSALMNEAIERLKNAGYKQATLWVLDTNTKSRQFYANKGWSIDGATKDEARDGFVLHEVRYRIDLR